MAAERNQGYTLKGLVSLCASFLFPVQPQGMQRTRGTLAVAVRVASAQVASSGAVEALRLQPATIGYGSRGPSTCRIRVEVCPRRWGVGLPQGGGGEGLLSARTLPLESQSESWLTVPCGLPDGMHLTEACA